MTVAYWQGRRFSWGPGGKVQMATAEERPLDDRLGTGEPRWKVSIAYVDRDGKVTSDIAEIPARNLEAPAFSRTPDLAVEMEAGRLARLVMRARNRG